jgi:hypothetical protein
LNGRSQFDNKGIDLLHAILLIDHPRSLLLLLYYLGDDLLEVAFGGFLLQLSLVLFEFMFRLNPNPFFNECNDIFGLANRFLVAGKLISDLVPLLISILWNLSLYL